MSALTETFRILKNGIGWNQKQIKVFDEALVELKELIEENERLNKQIKNNKRYDNLERMTLGMKYEELDDEAKSILELIRRNR